MNGKINNDSKVAMHILQEAVDASIERVIR